MSPAGGVEFGYLPIEGVTFAGRVGGRLPEKNAEAPLTLGASFTFDRLSLDYGFEPYQGREAHRVGLGFGRPTCGMPRDAGNAEKVTTTATAKT